MSDWGIDAVAAAGNTWSPLEDVAWIDAQSKSDLCVPQSGMPRTSSTELFAKVIVDESVGNDQTIHDEEDYKRRCKPKVNAKRGIFEQREIQRSDYTAQNRTGSPKGGWYDASAGNSHSVLPVTNLDKSEASLKGVGGKKEVSKYGFEGADVCTAESSYTEDGPDIVKSSCHFLLSDMCPPGGDLDFLGEVPDDARRENLLEFGWGNSNNTEDIDKLFLSTDSILSHDFDNNAGMLWEPPSPILKDSMESIHQSLKLPACGDIETREVTKDFEDEGEPIKSKSSLKRETASLAEGWRNSSHFKQYAVPMCDSSPPIEVNSCTELSNGNTSECQGFSTEGNGGSDCHERENIHPLNEIEKVCGASKFSYLRPIDENICMVEEREKGKAVKGKRHGPRSKRLEDNVRKSTGSQQRVAQNFGRTNSSPLMYMSVIPIAHDSAHSSPQVSWVSTCESISPMQGVQPVPYVHAGFGFPTHHRLPVVVPTPSLMPQQLTPQGHPVFISYQPQFIGSPKLQPSTGELDVLPQCYAATSTMTPQEKIEKLRWRQKMQARLAVEQQQQQLINQRLIPEQAQFVKDIPSINCEERLNGSIRLTQCDGPLTWNERSLSTEEATMEDEDESLTAAVLHQLLNIASKMDTRTRLCLRDGFCRLAGNAMQRRVASNNRGLKRSKSKILHKLCTADSSSSSEQSSSQRLLTVDDIVETETNPMDRFIAHLLFHKRFHSPFTTSDMNCTPCNNSEFSDIDVLHQNEFPWNGNNQSSHLSAATRSSSVTGEAVILKGQNSVLEVPNSALNSCEKPELWLKQEKAVNISAVSADNSFQHFVKREICTVDMDAGVCSAGYLVSSDEVAEPLL